MRSCFLCLMYHTKVVLTFRGSPSSGTRRGHRERELKACLSFAGFSVSQKTCARRRIGVEPGVEPGSYPGSSPSATRARRKPGPGAVLRRVVASLDETRPSRRKDSRPAPPPPPRGPARAARAAGRRASARGSGGDEGEPAVGEEASAPTISFFADSSVAHGAERRAESAPCDGLPPKDARGSRPNGLGGVSVPASRVALLAVALGAARALRRPGAAPRERSSSPAGGGALPPRGVTRAESVRRRQSTELLRLFFVAAGGEKRCSRARRRRAPFCYRLSPFAVEGRVRGWGGRGELPARAGRGKYADAERGRGRRADESRLSL